MDLSKTDLQKFIKRIRNNTQRRSIRYYAVGEYGGKTWRPHYHAIIFDVTPEEVTKAWRAENPKTNRYEPIGHIHFGTVSDDSIAYTAKYMYKPKRVPLHENDDRTPEFSLMSKGMGLNYLTPAIIDYHETTQSSFVTLPGGYIQPLPRIYRDRIFTPEEREHIASKLSTGHERRLQKAFEKAGGETEYYKNHVAMVQHEMRKFHKNQNKRDKI